MVDNSRQLELFNPTKFSKPIHIFGCGGMGSRMAEGLVRMGLGQRGRSPIYLYDRDTFESHNLANQWVDEVGVNSSKVHAVRRQMLAINPYAEVKPRFQKVVGGLRVRGVVFICVDTMTDRRAIMEGVILNSHRVKCVIETRMDAGAGVSHCFNPHNHRHLECWKLYWHSDGEAENMAGCGGPQSIISSVYGTTALALKQLERYYQKGSAVGIQNRVYHDFDTNQVGAEVWPYQ